MSWSGWLAAAGAWYTGCRGARGVVVGVAGRGGCVVHTHGLPWRVEALHGWP